jgi:hypothetical protein
MRSESIFAMLIQIRFRCFRDYTYSLQQFLSQTDVFGSMRFEGAPVRLADRATSLLGTIISFQMSANRVDSIMGV